jgi:arginase
MALGQPLTALQVVQVRYASHEYVGRAQRALAAYKDARVYEQAGAPFEVAEPQLPAETKGAEPDLQLGALGGAIADVVAEARRADKAILMTGGNCSHAPGVLGGLQDAHGPGARIGLVWFDAHGDFNTPRTSLTGHLGGMPVAVCAGLGLAEWRAGAHVCAPLPTDRIVLWDVRNLDPAEETLIRSTDAVIATSVAHLEQAVADLSERVDMIYLHVDADILDQAYMPHHRTKEPDGPDMDQVLAAIDGVMATGKVVAYAVVSVSFQAQGNDLDLASGCKLVRGGLSSWQQHGTLVHETRSRHDDPEHL